MKKGKLGLLSVSMSMVAALFAGTYFADKSELPHADPISVTDEKIDVTHLKGYPAYNPQDEYYSSQGIALDHLGDIKKVWDKTKGEGTTIAIIDSGIDWTHPDFYDEDGNSKLRMSDARYYAHVKGSSSNWTYPTAGQTIYTSDLKMFDTAHSYTIEGKTYSGNDVIRHNGDTSHGTNTASTAASFAHGNTDVGVIGIAPMAKILPIKVDMYMDSIGEALHYINDLNSDSDSTNNVDVVNISICGASTWSTITTYAGYLVNKGTIIVASAGNDNVSTLQYPAANPNIIGVGALENNSSTQKASFSNFNPAGSTSSSSNLNVEVTAPGHVYVADYTTYSTYKKTQGTSFSSPIVAGAAALWKSVNKSGTFSQFRTALHNSCVDIGSTGWDTTFGYGRLDVGSLVGTNDIVDITSVDLPASATVGENKTLQLTKTVVPSNATSKDFRWWSMNERVATVDHNGVVTGHSSGTATIYCKSLANDNIKDTCIVTVAGDVVAVTGISLNKTTLSLEVGNSETLTATIAPNNATNKGVVWSSSDNEVATVGNGVVEAVSKGTATIYARANEDDTIKATCTVTVTEAQSGSQYDPGTYYNTITATSGTSLLGQLHDLSVTKHTNYNAYSQDLNTTNYFLTDPYSSSNTVIRDFYTGAAVKNEVISSGTNGWNREHVWPQNLSNGLYGTSGPGADFQHLRPTIAKINSDRGNKKFGELNNSGTASTTTDYYGNTVTGGYYNTNVFQPIASKKGDVARIIMYMYMHYNKATNIGGSKDGSTTSYFGTLNFTHVISATNEAAAKQLLLTWNESDPVDDFERIRNVESAKITGARNPFIDHSEYANAIWGTVTPTKTLSSISLSGDYKTSFKVGEAFEFGGTIKAKYSDNSEKDVTSNVTFSGNNTSSEGTKTVTVSYSENGVEVTATYIIVVSTSGGSGDATGNNSITLTSTTNLDNFSIGDYIDGKIEKGTGSNPPKYYDSGTAVRCYAGNTITISSSTKEIVKIEFTFGSGDGTLAISLNEGSYSNGVWEGLSNEVIFTIGGSSGNRRISAIKVTYQDSGSTPTPTPKVNSITLDKTTLDLDLNGTKTATLTATVDADEGADKTVTWSSTDTSVATVLGGEVTGLKVGETTIKAEVGDKKAECHVFVSDSSATLISISYSGTTTLSVGESLEDYIITATYSDGSTKDVTALATLTTIDSTTAGLKSLKITYGDLMISQSILVISSGGGSTGGGSSYYEKVTSTADLTDGKYLIVYENGNVAFNGALTTIDAVKNTISVSISDNKIESTETTDAAAFTYASSDGSFLGTNSKYFGNGSNSNGLTTSTTVLKNTCSIDNGNLVCISSGGAYLRYNAASDQLRFRYYKSSSYTGQKAIQIYKLVQASVTPAPIDLAKTFAITFLSSFTCDGNGIKSPSFTKDWATLGQEYNLLSDEVKAIFANASYVLSGSEVTADNDTDETIAFAIARYDYVVGKYNYSNFISRTIQSNRSNKINSLNILSKIDDNPTNVTIAVLSLVGIASICGYFIIKKRKEI